MALIVDYDEANIPETALKEVEIKQLAEKLYIARLTGEYTARGFQESLYKQCLEEARKLIEVRENS